MKKTIKQDFFIKDSVVVAQKLIGKFVCRKNGETEERYQIIETEAYYHWEIYDNGKYICYGGGKTKEEAKKFVSAPLFDRPGTWCVYGGQLLLSVTDDKYSDNVLIKKIQDKNGKEYGPDKIAKTLHLYKSKPEYCQCHGKYSLCDDSPLYLVDGEKVETESKSRINVKDEKEYCFVIKRE
ncbi:DNA-3-methyladenine glycosylase [Massiliimalia massiliensis]|uniref:DNA-3-methyladenine glycosylase n=1 Tax=Massiliimalia massiliensis TaxID=1852384 RepID=UPI0013565535|nr:DNA-3-methyladenine glycosylase [Massiliimalia massiliensis]